MSDELKEYQVGPLVFRLSAEDAKERGLSAADLDLVSKRRKAPANKTSAAASKDADDAADSADGTD